MGGFMVGTNSGYSPKNTYDRIKELLEKNGYDVSSDEKMGEVLKTSKSSVQRWKNNFPRVDDLIFISQKFGVSLDWLVFGKEENKKDSSAETAEKPIEENTLKKDTDTNFTVYDICKAFANLSRICNIRIISESNQNTGVPYADYFPITIKMQPKFRVKPIELKSFKTAKREYSLFSVSNFRNIRKCDYACYFIDNRGHALIDYLYATYGKFQKTHMHECDMTKCFISNLDNSYDSWQTLNFNLHNGEIDDLIKNITYFPSKYGISSDGYSTYGRLKDETISYFMGTIETYLHDQEKENY